MSQFSRETKDLIAAGRLGRRMPQKERDRLKRVLLANIAAGSVTTSTAAAAWLTLGAKVTGALAIVGVVTAGAVTLTRGPSPDASPATSATATHGPLGRPAHASPIATAPSETPTTAVASAPPPSATVLTSAAPSVARAESEPAQLVAPPATSRGVHRRPRFAPQLAPPASVLDAPPPDHGAPAARLAPPSEPAASTSPAWSASPASPPSPPSQASRSSPLSEEARLLRDADAALRTGDAREAFALLDEHAARFPRGTLEPERSAERILALCQTGRIDEARAEASAFLTRHPSGPLAARIAASCGGPRR